MKVHKIKLLSKYWIPVKKRIKTAEIRYNDRDYAVGDKLKLYEWDGGEYTGKKMSRKITGVFPLDDIGLNGWVLLSIK